VDKGIKTLISRLQPFPTLVLCILAFSIYFPHVFAPIPLIGTRALLTSVLVSLTFLALLFVKRIWSNSISLHILVLATIFPIYLAVIGAVQGRLGLTFFGNSDRSLGLVTYLTCSGFFLFGTFLRKFYEDSLAKIILSLGIFQVIVIGTSYFGLTTDRKQGSFFNSNPNALLTGLISVFILTWIIDSNIKYRLQIAYALCGFFGTLLFWLDALQAIIGFLITVCIIGVTKIKGRSTIPFKYYSNSIIALGVIFFVFIGVSKPPTRLDLDQSSYGERLDIYKTSFRAISENFFFGLGVDQFNLGYYQLNQSGSLKLVDNAHSIPLHLLSTIGIFGALVFYALFLLILKQSYSQTNSTMNAIRNSIFFYLLSGFFAIQTPSIEGIVFLMLGYLINKDQIRSKGNFRDNLTRITLGSVGLVGVLSLACTLSPLIQISQAFGENSKNVSRTNGVIRQNINNVYDLGVLLILGKYSIAIGDKPLGLSVLNRMLNISNMDQRTIALALLIASKYEDRNLESVGIQLNEIARS